MHRHRRKQLEKTFKEKFGKELPLKLTPHHPTHIPVEQMMQMVVKASLEGGFDSYQPMDTLSPYSSIILQFLP